MEEKKHTGKMDLPQSIGHLIARLLQQKFPSEMASINRDGTLIITFNDKNKMDRYKKIELEFSSLYFKYELIDTEIITGDADCPHCGRPYIKTTYYAFYELKEIWKGRHDVTEQYKIGGDLTESKVGVSAIKEQQIAQTELQQEELLFYT